MTDFSVFFFFNFLYILHWKWVNYRHYIIMCKQDTESVKVAPESLLSNRGNVEGTHLTRFSLSEGGYLRRGLSPYTEWIMQSNTRATCSRPLLSVSLAVNCMLQNVAQLARCRPTWQRCPRVRLSVRPLPVCLFVHHSLILSLPASYDVLVPPAPVPNRTAWYV